MKPKFNVVDLVMKVGHEIDSERVIFKRNPSKPGNALKQFEDALNEVLDAQK